MSNPPTTGRPRSSPVYLAAARDDLLTHLLAGKSLNQAALLIGANVRAVQRYALACPEFGEKMRAAMRGEPVEPEVNQVMLARLVHEAVPFDAAGAPRHAGPRRDGPTREQFERRLSEVLDDPESKHWGKAAEICARYFYGPEMLKALRQAEREAEQAGDGEKPQRILVIRVPTKAVE